MGKLSVLIGGLIMLLAHTIQYQTTDLLDSKFITITGFFLFWVSTEVGNTNDTNTETIDGDWLDKNGIYEILFGSSEIGILILALIIVAIVMVFVKEGPISGWLLLAAGILLLVFRFIELNDQDNFFFEDNDTSMYLEIPLGFLAGLITGLMNIRSS